MHIQVDNHELLFVVLFEGLMFVFKQNFLLKSQNPNHFTFHEKHFSLGWVAAVSFTIHHYSSFAFKISFEQKEDDGFLVMS